MCSTGRLLGALRCGAASRLLPGLSQPGWAASAEPWPLPCLGGGQGAKTAAVPMDSLGLMEQQLARVQ